MSLLSAPGSRLPGLIDLAAERAGGRAIVANDEFFAPKENLLKSGRGVFIDGKYTDRGKWMDGWETRRRREPGHDWCVVRLGIAGVVRTVTVDTNHFRGNYPEACSIDAADVGGDPDAAALARAAWRELLPRSPLAGHAENDFPVAHDGRVTHVRLNIFPDGGVARLRIHGEARPDWAALAASGAPIDLVAVEHGGLPVASSDEFFGEPLNLLMPGRPANMGDGWETKRRRGPGHDWVIVRLGRPGAPDMVEIDTTHFKGNFPESASLDGCHAVGGPGGAPAPDAAWRELLPRTRLAADTPHRFPIVGAAPVTHVRLNIFPDGGVARL
jgi:allantoicase